MSELGELESAVVGLLAGVESGGEPLFRSVSGFAAADRRQAVARLGGLAAPAALVAYAGRERADTTFGVIGGPRVTVLVRAENLRGGEDVRVGDGSAVGAFDLLASVVAVLDGAIVTVDRRLTAIDEQVVAADETHAVYEQRYLVERTPHLTAPTFDGAAVAGADSIVRVEVGDVESDAALFAFPGIDGVFRHQLGMRQRAIRWVGQLRSANDAGLNAIEAALEAAVADPRAHVMADAWSRQFAECVLERFTREGPRRRHPVTGQALQGFECVFGQLSG
ncbi:MAG: hypothetical protein HOP29_08660 [Phycisphaerales bacterium]|nr:hypothetical protein [Phycisphaerales bacterium]